MPTYLSFWLVFAGTFNLLSLFFCMPLAVLNHLFQIYYLAVASKQPYLCLNGRLAQLSPTNSEYRWIRWQWLSVNIFKLAVILLCFCAVSVNNVWSILPECLSHFIVEDEADTWLAWCRLCGIRQPSPSTDSCASLAVCWDDWNPSLSSTTSDRCQHLLY